MRKGRTEDQCGSIKCDDNFKNIHLPGLKANVAEVEVALRRKVPFKLLERGELRRLAVRAAIAENRMCEAA